ncbi:MAG: hypothetical protein ABGY71_02280 [bacterium]|jgi:tetratricopeptide (TPR) repeat protein|nr:hypothetical protein [Planctomycetota bacterium]HIL52205.1 hypothetical protein [Planctomycetota bacterium]
MKLSASTRRSLHDMGTEFVREFLETDLVRHPKNTHALAELGQIYTSMELWDLGLSVDRQLVNLLPESSTAYYNLGCSLALLALTDEALQALEQSVDLGYNDADHMLTDDDLVSLHDQGRFRALLERIHTLAHPSLD